MTKFKYNELLENLRNLYREGKFIELKKKYLLAKWLLTPEDRERIESVIGVYKIAKQDPLVEFCEKEMGYKTVNNLDKD